MSASLETWIGAGALVGNMWLTVSTGRKMKVVAQSTAADAAQAVKVAAQEQVQVVRETVKIAANNAASGAKEGAAGALNGTAGEVKEIKRLLTDHIENTTKRFDEQDECIAGIIDLGKSNSRDIRTLKLAKNPKRRAS